MNEFSAQDILSIGALVLLLTEIAKFAGLPDRMGLLAAGIFSAMGVGFWTVSNPNLVLDRFIIWPLFAAFVTVLATAAGAFGFVRAARAQQLTTMDPSKASPPKTPMVVLPLLLSIGLAGCANRQPVVLVAQGGQTLAGTIGQAQRATAQLVDGKVLTPDRAKVIQQHLLDANGKLAPLPDLLIAIDEATQQGRTDAQRIASALAILRSVGIDVDAVIAGLPVGETAANVLQAATEARRLINQITEALARRSPSAAVLTPALDTL